HTQSSPASLSVLKVPAGARYAHRHILGALTLCQSSPQPYSSNRHPLTACRSPVKHCTGKFCYFNTFRVTIQRLFPRRPAFSAIEQARQGEKALSHHLVG